MSGLTEAAVLFEASQPLRIMSLPIPELKPGQILVKVAYAGVCGSQLLEVQGKRGPDPYLPHALGHEGSGTVLEIGPGVNKVKPGDRVVLSWIRGQGADVPSTVYESSEGPINAGGVTTFMCQTVTCESRVTSIPDTIPLREAALLGCAIPTGAGIIFNVAELEAGSSIAIFGAGGIGLSAVLAASFREAATIIAVDIFDHKLEHARLVGATDLINARHRDPLTAVAELTDGRGVDYAVEAVGLPETMEAAFHSVRDHGGLCILAGNLAHGQRISIDPFDLIKGKRIVGTWGGETSPDRDIPLYVDMYLSGKFKVGALVTHTYPLEEIDQVFNDLKQGKVGRALIQMDRQHC